MRAESACVCRGADANVCDFDGRSISAGCRITSPGAVVKHVIAMKNRAWDFQTMTAFMPRRKFLLRYLAPTLVPIIAIAGLVAAGIGPGCAGLIQSVVKAPKVSFYGVTVRDAGAEGATAVIALNVENPNGVSLTVDRLKYKLEMAGRNVAEAEIQKVATLAAHSTSKVEIPVPFRYDQVFASVLDLLSKGSAAYKVTGTASIGLFNLPFDHSGDMKLRE